MKVHVQIDENRFTANRALVFYRQCMTGDIIATVNEIEDNQLLKGVPVDTTELQRFFREIKRSGKAKASGIDWTDPRQIATAPDVMVWYHGPCRKEIFFSCGDKKAMKLSGKTVCWPGLVFLLRSTGLSVFAVKGNRKPGADTALYHAPFWNIYGSGRICMPEVFRKSTAEQTIDNAERIFYGSAFSHPIGNMKERLNYPGGFIGFYETATALNLRHYPTGVLLPTGKTLKEEVENGETQK